MNKDTLVEQQIKKLRELLDKERRDWNTGNDMADLTSQGINIGHDEAFRIGEKLIKETIISAQQETIQALEEIIGEDEPLTKKQKTRRYLGQYKYGEDVEIDTPHENRDANKARNELRAELRKKLSSLKEIKDEK